MWGMSLFLTRLLLEVVPDWRPALGGITVLYVGACMMWCWLQGGWLWLRHFSWACGFLLLAVPWPYQIETALVQGLARTNATLVADSLILMDLPVRAAGNTLLTSHGDLGIEKACSGILSLQASILMGLFLGEFYQLARKRRLGLLLLAFFLALAGNYFRLLFLAWNSERNGWAGMESGHNAASLGIMIFTLAGLGAASFLLRGKNRLQIGYAMREAGVSRPVGESRRWAIGVLVGTLIVEVFTQGWFAWRAPAPSPVWKVNLPFQARGFRSLPLSAATHELLGDRETQTGTWQDDRAWLWQAFWFRYQDQQVNHRAVELHTPEVCLPAVGQKEELQFTPSFWRKGKLTLSVRSFLFTSGSVAHYVFWIVSQTDDRPEPRDRTALVYEAGLSAFLGRLDLWTHDAWLGLRAEPSESLEVTLAGPSDHREAEAAFRQFLDQALVPPSMLSVSASR